MEQREESPFDFFNNSEKVEEIQNKLSSNSILDVILEARKNSKEEIIYLISKSLKPIKNGFLKNETFSGNANLFMNRFVEQLLIHTKKKLGPFWTVDILDGNDKEQLDQLGIEFYSFSKGLTTQVEEVSEGEFPEEQEVHPVIKQTGFFDHLVSINPEYAQIFSHMAHYTPSDEIVQEMELSGLNSLKAKIQIIKQLAESYFESPDRESDVMKFEREI